VVDHTPQVPHGKSRQATHDVAVYVYVFVVFLKFFGRLCVCVGQDTAAMVRSLPMFVEVALQSAMDPGDVSTWGIAVDTIGLLLSLPPGRQGLLSQQQAILAVLAQWGRVLVSGSGDHRVRVLGAIEMIVSCEETPPRWEESLSLRWCTVMHAEFCHHLLSLARQPFPDLAVAALRVQGGAPSQVRDCVSLCGEWVWPGGVGQCGHVTSAQVSARGRVPHGQRDLRGLGQLLNDMSCPSVQDRDHWVTSCDR